MRRRNVLVLPALALAATRAQAALERAVRTRVETHAGAFVIEVDLEVAPVTVANYLAHVDRGLLDAP